MIRLSRVFSVVALLAGLVAAQSVRVQSGQNTADERPRRVTDQPQTDSPDDKPVKLSANLVTVLASVSNSTGDLVSNLGKTDFEMFEDNVRQEISGFYPENQMPLHLVFLFDTSGSIRSRFDFERRAASLFVREVLRPGDEAAIYSVGTDPKREIGFTSDLGSIAATLDQLQPGGATALYSATLEAAKYLRQTPGRHVILVLSDGEDTSSTVPLAKALTEVQKSDAVIYCVHSMGISLSANIQARTGEKVLKSMSDDTGGLAYFPVINSDHKKEARELDEIYTRIAADIRGQYLLTYYSNQTRSGLFRAIRVQVSRPGLSVRARRGYFAAD